MNTMGNVVAIGDAFDHDPPRARRVEPGAAEQAQMAMHARRRERLRKLAILMDSSLEIPVFQIRFGLDPILGLLPVLGAIVTLGAGLYTIYEAIRLGTSKTIIAKMLLNIGIDFAAGEIPVIGDIFDVAFKAHMRNLRLLGIDARGVHVQIDPAAAMGSRPPSGPP